MRVQRALGRWNPQKCTKSPGTPRRMGRIARVLSECEWKVHTFGFEDEESTCILGFIFQIGRERHGIYIKSIVSRRTTAHLHRHCHLQILLRPLLLPRRHHFCRVLCFPRFFRHHFTPLLSNIPIL